MQSLFHNLIQSQIRQLYTIYLADIAAIRAFKSDIFVATLLYKKATYKRVYRWSLTAKIEASDGVHPKPSKPEFWFS